jgi:hypothetical protein
MLRQPSYNGPNDKNDAVKRLARLNFKHNECIDCTDRRFSDAIARKESET